MAKAALPQLLDVMVIGGHPSAHTAAAVLGRDFPKLKIAQVTPPDEVFADRMHFANPQLLQLHPAITACKPLAALPTSPGLRFLSGAAGIAGEYVSKKPAMLIGSMSTISRATGEMARQNGAEHVAPARLQVLRVVDDGVQLAIDDQEVVARVILLAAVLSVEQARILGIASTWEEGVMHRYSFLRFKPGKGVLEMPPNRTVPMSLDLGGTNSWAWLLIGEGNGQSAQLAVQQPIATARSHPPTRLMQMWIDQLTAHGIIKMAPKLPAISALQTLDVPIAGALSSETVANRTLLIGPAGGFYSACGEEIYPACWSAVAAAPVAAKALQERHVQDSLQAYRAEWGTTLGDYLRGPQQNLTLLLPLVYKNAVMASRVGEAILFGESVVR